MPISAASAPELAALTAPRGVRNSPETVTAGDEYLPRASDLKVWHAQRPLDGPVVAASGAASWETRVDRGSRIELATHAPAARAAAPGALGVPGLARSR